MNLDEDVLDLAEHIAFDMERIGEILLLISTSDLSDSKGMAAGYIGEKIDGLASDQKALVEIMHDERRMK